MNDFILIKLKNKKEFNFYRPVNNPKLKRYQYRLKEILIDLVSLENEQKFKYETNEFLFLLCGDVFYPEGHKKEFKRIPLKEVAENDAYFKNPEKQLRGYFIIIKINKRTQRITLINDVFGIIPVYFGNIDNNYVISTSLSILNSLNIEINEQVLAERILFYNSLSNNTLIKNIYSLGTASILTLNHSFKVKQYYNWNDFFDMEKLSMFSIKEYIEEFNKIILNRANLNNENLITLTGGHDGRAVLSSFIKNKLKFETFSFGRPGSENTSIPERIAKEMNFTHHSIYLEDDFEKDYYNNALETLWLSDGELSFEQQSTLHAVKKMSQKFTINYTGLIAGEILGPIHLIKDYLTPLYYLYIYKNNPFNLSEALEKIGIENYINKKYLELYVPDILKNISRRIYSNNQINLKFAHLRYLFDLIQFGFRKFYGYQMHLMRTYIRNIPVFYDFDLLKKLVHSNYNKIYRHSFHNKLSKFNSRKIQCSIIANNSPELAKIPLDRGYPPYWSIHPLLKYLRIIPYKIRKNKLKKGGIPPDFISEIWSKHISNNEIIESILGSESNIFFKENIIKYLEKLKKDSLYYNFETNRIISLFMYVNKILKNK